MLIRTPHNLKSARLGLISITREARAAPSQMAGWSTLSRVLDSSSKEWILPASIVWCDWSHRPTFTPFSPSRRMDDKYPRVKQRSTLCDDARRISSHVDTNFHVGRLGSIRVWLLERHHRPTRLYLSYSRLFHHHLLHCRGDIVHVTSWSQIIGPDAQRIVLLHDRLSTILRDVTCSPLVGYLIKSRHLSSAFDNHSPAVATLKGVVLQNLTIGIFTWESSRELDIFPGEAIIFDFSAFIGHQGSAYRAPLPNLRRIRTSTTFSSYLSPTCLVMLDNPGGAARRARWEGQSVLLGDASSLSLIIVIVGLAGVIYGSMFTVEEAYQSGDFVHVWLIFVFASATGSQISRLLCMVSTPGPDAMTPVGHPSSVACPLSRIVCQPCCRCRRSSQQWAYHR